MATVEHYLQRHQELKREAAPWLPLYQLIAEYIRTRKQNFTNDVAPGAFLNEQVFDSTAVSANHLAASSIVGALWPNGARSIQLKPPFLLTRAKLDTSDVLEWYRYATEQMVEVMDAPEAGLSTALDEYMLDQLAFGLAGLGAFEKEDDETPFVFKAIDAKSLGLDEDNDGIIDTIYIEKEMTVRQIVMQYGKEEVSKEIRDLYDNNDLGKKFKILHVIEPRKERNLNSFSSKDMPISSVHIELQSKKKIKESGFIEAPIFITRFWKAVGEKRGRSPGMAALPDILELNAIREAVPIAIEKNLDPPLAVFDDGTLGGGTINTSAGSITVFSINGRAGMGAQRSPVEPLVTVGELNSSYTRITELTESVNNHFFKDRLMDFNNETRMTLGETHLRNSLREQSLGATYARQLKELFLPLCQRVFNALLRRGYFGVIRGSKEEQEIIEQGGEPFYIPDVVANLMLMGKQVYKVKFVCPAARIMQSEELLGIQRTAEFALGVVPAQPEVLDILDLDDMIRRVADLTGAPEQIVRPTDTVENIRKNRAEQQQALQEEEQARNNSETVRNIAQARQMAQDEKSKAA